MNKNRIFIIAASAVAILGSFLPWASASAGALGSMTISGTQGDGWLIIFLAIVSIVLSCLKNYEKPSSDILDKEKEGNDVRKMLP